MSEREKLLIEYLQRVYEMARDDRPKDGSMRPLPRLPNNRQLIAQVALEGLWKVNTPEAPIWPFERGTFYWIKTAR
jgi:hypothetical protein